MVDAPIAVLVPVEFVGLPALVRLRGHFPTGVLLELPAVLLDGFQSLSHKLLPEVGQPGAVVELLETVLPVVDGDAVRVLDRDDVLQVLTAPVAEAAVVPAYVGEADFLDVRQCVPLLSSLGRRLPPYLLRPMRRPLWPLPECGMP